jgi:hypothetical protein
MMEGIKLADYERAEAELRAEEGSKSFFVHASIYVLVNFLLLVINLIFVPAFLWFYFPLIGWGLGLTMHYLGGVRFVQSETEEWQAKVEHRAIEIHVREASPA